MIEFRLKMEDIEPITTFFEYEMVSASIVSPQYNSFPHSLVNKLVNRYLVNLSNQIRLGHYR